MLSYILKRIGLMIPTLLGALTVTFIVMQFVPGGPVEQILAEARAGAGAQGTGYKAGRDIDAKQREALMKQYGFDKPAHERYFKMLADFARFDLGKSFMQNKGVWELIKEKLPVSVSLGLWTFLISYAISIPLGVAKAVREGTRFDAITTSVSYTHLDVYKRQLLARLDQPKGPSTSRCPSRCSRRCASTWPMSIARSPPAMSARR